MKHIKTRKDIYKTRKHMQKHKQKHATTYTKSNQQTQHLKTQPKTTKPNQTKKPRRP